MRSLSLFLLLFRHRRPAILVCSFSEVLVRWLLDCILQAHWSTLRHLPRPLLLLPAPTPLTLIGFPHFLFMFIILNLCTMASNTYGRVRL